MLTIALVSCSNGTIKDDHNENNHNDNHDIVLPKTLKESVAFYKGKIESILEEDEKTSTSTSSVKLYNDTPYNPENMLEKKEYMDVYNQQVDHTHQVSLPIYLDMYKTLLIDMDEVLKTCEIDDIEMDIVIDFGSTKELEVNISLSKDLGVLIKFQIQSFFNDAYYDNAIKTGYEGDVFYIKQLVTFSDNENRFTYFEFREDHSLINISYINENSYDYSYVSQVDNTTFKLNMNGNAFHPNIYRLFWYNPETNIQTIYSNEYDHARHFSLFNDKGIIFEYTDNLDDTITLWFQLLEADGWDYAYLDSDAHKNQGVYKNGVMLFDEDEYRQFNVDLYPQYQKANVSVTIDLNENELTNEILNLNAYEMDFNHPEITVDYINETIENAYEESKDFAVYRGIDFYGSNIYDQFIDVIDKDLLKL